MKLLFKTSQKDKLNAAIRANPECIGVSLTHQELLSIYEELIKEGHSNCVLLSSRQYFIDGVTYPVVIKD